MYGNETRASLSCRSQAALSPLCYRRCYFTTNRALWANEWTTASWPAWKTDLVNTWPQPGQDMAGKSWWTEISWGTFEKDGLKNPTDTVFVRDGVVNEDTGTVLR